MEQELAINGNTSPNRANSCRDANSIIARKLLRCCLQIHRVEAERLLWVNLNRQNSLFSVNVGQIFSFPFFLSKEVTFNKMSLKIIKS